MSNSCFNSTTTQPTISSKLMSKSYSPYRTFVSSMDSSIISNNSNSLFEAKKKNDEKITQKPAQILSTKSNISDESLPSNISNLFSQKLTHLCNFCVVFVMKWIFLYLSNF